jgi:hypothetical protein
MIGVSGGFEVGSVNVHTTQNRGFSPDEIAERCLDKIISVADTAVPEVQAQAQAFKDRIRAVLVFYMKEAANSDRTTVYNALLDAGQKDLAELIRRM